MHLWRYWWSWWWLAVWVDVVITKRGRIGGGNAEIYAAVAVAVATMALSLIDNFVFKPNNAFIPVDDIIIYIIVLLTFQNHSKFYYISILYYKLIRLPFIFNLLISWRWISYSTNGNASEISFALFSPFRSLKSEIQIRYYS